MEHIDSMYHTPKRIELEAPLYLTWVGHRECDATHCIGPRVIPTYKIVLVVKGSGFFVLNGANVLIRTGDMFVCFPNVKHHYFANPKDPWTIKWVAFNGKSCAHMMETISLRPENPILRDSGLQSLTHYFVEICESLKRDNEYAYAATGNTYLLFDEILRMRREEVKPEKETLVSDELLHRILTFIELNYNAELNVELISQHVNYSRSHFSHLFKQRMGISLPEYINDRRVEHAKVLLRTTMMNSMEIALSVGYKDTVYFSKIFKKLTHMTPMQYRSKCR